MNQSVTREGSRAVAKLIVDGHEVVNTQSANEALAHLQIATHQRFENGQGYFLTIL